MITLPEQFVEMMRFRLMDDYSSFEASLQQEPSVSVRVNNKQRHSLTNNVPWCNSGYYLNERPLFTLDPLLHAGCYYVQEASSMFLQRIVEQYVGHSDICLDMCAAPGGKSLILSDWVEQSGLIVSNEIMPQRCAILAENHIKWGNNRVIVTNNAPEAFEALSAMFDTILVDAPCSGEGMFRKDEKAIEEWSIDNVNLCVHRQRTILQSAIKALKPNGILIYSTCTYNTHEDEEQIQWLIDEYGFEYLPVAIDANWNIEQTLGYHFWQHRINGEGLFMAVLRKPDGENNNMGKTKKQQSVFTNKVANTISDTLVGGDISFALHNNIWRGIAGDVAPYLDKILGKLKVVHWGTLLFEEKGKTLIPQQSLALSKQLNTNQFNICNVDGETALRFLMCEPIALPNAEKGYLLLTYQGQPIGYVKNIGNRCNNLYPNAWRIRMTAHDVVNVLNTKI